MLIREALVWGEKKLITAGIEEARTECEHMLMHLLHFTRAQLLLKAQDVLTFEQEKQFLSWVEQREKRIPLAYLLGDAFFLSLKLKVGPGCLIPRPETERLVEEALKLILENEWKAPVIMDLGTGSGAIALAILDAEPLAKAVMVDFSAEALKMARENVAELGFLNRAELFYSDLYLDIPSDLKVDLILSNPPYLTAEDLCELQPEVAFEPRMALDGGKDGLDFYRKIISGAKSFLKPQGWLGLEVGAGQSVVVSELLKKQNYGDVRVFRDHQDIERIVMARCSF